MPNALKHISSLTCLLIAAAAAGCSRADSGKETAAASTPVATPSPAATPAGPPPGEIAEKWQTDFSVFASQLEKLRRSQNVAAELPADGGHAYGNKRVRWTLSLKAVTAEPGKAALEFDLEPHGIKEQFFSGSRLIMVGVTADTTSGPNWQSIKSGSLVTFEGICDRVQFVKMTPPGGSPKVVAVASVRGAVPGKVEEVDERLSGEWRFVMSSNEWTVRLRPRPGLQGEFIGTARRTKRDEQGEVVTAELGAALQGSKIRAWLGQFVLCEAPFKPGQTMVGSCQALMGTLMGDGGFKAERR